MDDVQDLIERLPDAHISMPFVVNKRICASTNGWQFITSSYPNRSKDRNTFNSMDGMFGKGFLRGLKVNEADCVFDGKQDPRQGIGVRLHISRIKQAGWKEMYIFGYNSRLLSPVMPLKVKKTKDGTSSITPYGCIYISSKYERDYFKDMEDGAIFPVYVKIERKE